MRVSKRIFALLLAACMAVLLAGCGEKAKEPDAKELLSSGYEYMDSGDLSNAVKAFERVLELEPDNSECWKALAEAYWMRGEHEKALAVLEEGMESVEYAEPLQDMYDRISGSVEPAVEITEKIDPVKPEPERDESETEAEQEQEPEPEQEPVTAPGERHELTVDWDVLDNAVFCDHGELCWIYGACSSEYNELGWTVRYENCPVYFFYGYEWDGKVDEGGIPFDDAKPNMCMCQVWKIVSCESETATWEDFADAFGGAEYDQDIMSDGYYVYCGYKGYTVAFGCDAEGNVLLSDSWAEIYFG